MNFVRPSPVDHENAPARGHFQGSNVEITHVFFIVVRLPTEQRLDCPIPELALMEVDQLRLRVRNII